jgi:hypothetical protein
VVERHKTSWISSALSPLPHTAKSSVSFPIILINVCMRVSESGYNPTSHYGIGTKNNEERASRKSRYRYDV